MLTQPMDKIVVREVECFLIFGSMYSVDFYGAHYSPHLTIILKTSSAISMEGNVTDWTTLRVLLACYYPHN